MTEETEKELEEGDKAAARKRRILRGHMEH